MPGTKPTVYIGSYDGNFYALDARNGKERWKYRAGGRISGSATVVGDVVYFANLGDKETSGIDVRNGRRVFKYPRGSFTPVDLRRQAALPHGLLDVCTGSFRRTPEARRRRRATERRE